MPGSNDETQTDARVLNPPAACAGRRGRRGVRPAARRGWARAALLAAVGCLLAWQPAWGQEAPAGDGAPAEVAEEPAAGPEQDGPVDGVRARRDDAEQRQAARAVIVEALDQLPRRFDAVLIVRNPEALSNDLAFLNKTLELGIEELDGLLGEVRRMSGLSSGVRNDLPLMLLVPSFATTDAPPVVLLLPVRDYTALVTSLGGDENAAVAAVTTPDGHQGYMRNLDGYAVGSGSRRLVETYAPAEAGEAFAATLGRTAVDALGGSDIAMLASRNGANRLKGALRGVMQRLPINELPDQAGHAIRAALGAVDALIDDAAWVTVAASGDRVGFSATLAVSFEEGSEMARIFQENAPARPLLNDLPRRPYMVASAVNLRGVDVPRLVERIAPRPTGTPRAARDVLASYLARIAPEVEGAAQMIYAAGSAQEFANGAVRAVQVIASREPAATLAQLRQFVSALDGRRMRLTVDDAVADAPVAARTFADDLVVRGVNIDFFQFSYSFDPAFLRQHPSAGRLIAMGLTGFRGAMIQRPGRVALTSVDDPPLVTSLTTLPQRESIGDEALVQFVRQRGVPRDSFFEAYFNVAGFVELNQLSERLFGQTEEGVAPPDLSRLRQLPPAALSGRIDGSTLTLRAFAPFDTVVRLYRGPQSDAESAPDSSPASGAGTDPGPAEGPGGALDAEAERDDDTDNGPAAR